MPYPSRKIPAQPAPNFHAEKPVRHLNQIELSRRWSISPRTLERWRWLKQEPAYLKVGGRVVYKLEDIEQYEASQRQVITSKRGRS